MNRLSCCLLLLLLVGCGRSIESPPLTPEPGADGGADLAPSIRFLPPRGIHDAPLEIELDAGRPFANGVEGFSIRYTLDGSRPGPNSGQAYGGPIGVDRTTVLRAQVFRGAEAVSSVVSHSYILPESLLGQPERPPDLPEHWGVYANSAVPADYGMDRRVTESPAHRSAILRSFAQLPSVSLSLSPDGLFGPDEGIYSHPLARGREWEREASIELIDPTGTEPGFQVDAGLRIHGNTSRYPDETAKHSLRIRFRGDYGPKKLDYPLFEGEPEARYETLVLRALINDSVLINPEKAQYVRDAWLRESERELLGLATVPGRFVHLFLNGLYWGLYELVERPDESFAARIHGGQAKDYVVVDDAPRDPGETSEDAWSRVLSLAEQGLEDPERYRALTAQLDIDDFIDHWILGQYAARSHWPAANWTVIASREPEGRVYFPAWDAEAALLDLSLDRSTTAKAGSPAQLYSRLRRNPDFQARFDARLREHFAPGGLLYVDPEHPGWDPARPEANRPAARYAALVAIVEDAVVAESARWSDWEDSAPPPHDRDRDWIPARDFVLGTFFRDRGAILLEQFEARGLYLGPMPQEIE